MSAVRVIEAETIGAAWLAVAGEILDGSLDARYDGDATKELTNVTIVVATPDPGDALIAEFGDPDWSAWMRRNFTEPEPVAELGDAASYATRLHDYNGRDQIAWIIDRLRFDPECRSATITTLQPLTDTEYIPASACWTSGAPNQEGLSSWSSTRTASISARRHTATWSSLPASTTAWRTARAQASAGSSSTRNPRMSMSRSGS